MGKRTKDLTEDEIIEEQTTKKKKVVEKKECLKTYSFPKQWFSVKAKSLEEAEKKMKVITGYRNKQI